MLITLVPFLILVSCQMFSVYKKKKKVTFRLDLEFENQTVLSSSGIISNSNVCSPFQSSLLEFPTFQVWVSELSATEKLGCNISVNEMAVMVLKVLEME